MAKEPVEASLDRCSGSICHFHISEPYLGAIGGGEVDHPQLASILDRIGYDHWTSIEMRHNPEVPTLEGVESALAYAADVYGGEKDS